MGFAKVRITAPYAACLPTQGDLLTGSANPLYGLVTFLNDSVPKSDRYTTDGITYTWNAELLLEMLSVNLMTAVGASGAEFYDVPLFAEIDLTANVPAQWQGTDEEGDPVARTWQEYFDATTGRNPLVIGDKTYAALKAGNRYLPFSEAAALGFTLLTKPEINALQAANQPEE